MSVELPPTESVTSTAGLNPAEIRRYSRHLIMPEVGVEGQERLKQAKILMVGAGKLLLGMVHTKGIMLIIAFWLAMDPLIIS